MNKIKPQDCVAGKWYYCEESKERLLCVHTTEKAGLFIADVNSRGNCRNFVMSRIETLLMTPLHDCTSWDWVAPPQYRPFKDAWEFVQSAYGRRIVWQTDIMVITAVDFEEHPLCVKLGGGWYSLKALCEQFTFEDTGSPCGVKL
jgi:hypothetical protein